MQDEAKRSDVPPPRVDALPRGATARASSGVDDSSWPDTEVDTAVVPASVAPLHPSEPGLPNTLEGRADAEDRTTPFPPLALPVPLPVPVPVSTTVRIPVTQRAPHRTHRPVTLPRPNMRKVPQAGEPRDFRDTTGGPTEPPPTTWVPKGMRPPRPNQRPRVRRGDTQSLIAVCADELVTAFDPVAAPDSLPTAIEPPPTPTVGCAAPPTPLPALAVAPPTLRLDDGRAPPALRNRWQWHWHWRWIALGAAALALLISLRAATTNDRKVGLARAVLSSSGPAPITTAGAPWPVAADPAPATDDTLRTLVLRERAHVVGVAITDRPAEDGGQAETIGPPDPAGAGDATAHAEGRAQAPAAIQAGDAETTAEASASAAPPPAASSRRKRSRKRRTRSRRRASSTSATPVAKPPETAVATPPKPAPPPKPKPKPKPKPTSVRDETPEGLLADAKRALARGHNKSAYSLASQSDRKQRTGSALRVMARAACRMKHAEQAKSAFIKLSVRERAGVREECRRNDVRLGI